MRTGWLGLFIGCVMLTLPLMADVNLSRLGKVTGHRVRIDNNIGDWVGLPPLKENTAVVDKGEYIYRDAKNDDIGAGKYNYPTHEKVQKGGDLREFRVTFDEERLYLMIKTERPNEWWANYRLIAIDQDGHTGGLEGTRVLAQGDIDELDSYNGCYGELAVSNELAAEFVIGLSSTYKGRVWDSHGRMVAMAEGSENDTPGFKVGDANWYAMEVAIPFKIVGDPRGKTWRFIVATGLQDNDFFREIRAEQGEWAGSGTRDKSNYEDGPDPDAYDLAGASLKKQIEDLKGYRPKKGPPDSSQYCTIRNSYLTVSFALPRTSVEG